MGTFYSGQREGTEAIPSDAGLPLLRFCKKTYLTRVFGTLAVYTGSWPRMQELRMRMQAQGRVSTLWVSVRIFFL